MMDAVMMAGTPAPAIGVIGAGFGRTGAASLMQAKALQSNGRKRID